LLGPESGGKSPIAPFPRTARTLRIRGRGVAAGDPGAFPCDGRFRGPTRARSAFGAPRPHRGPSSAWWRSGPGPIDPRGGNRRAVQDRCCVGPSGSGPVGAAVAGGGFVDGAGFPVFQAVWLSGPRVLDAEGVRGCPGGGRSSAVAPGWGRPCSTGWRRGRGVESAATASWYFQVGSGVRRWAGGAPVSCRAAGSRASKRRSRWCPGIRRLLELAGESTDGPGWRRRPARAGDRRTDPGVAADREGPLPDLRTGIA